MMDQIKKLDYIDSLRGLAVISVVFHHTKEFITINTNNFFGDLIDKSSLGVQLFYIISAYTLLLSKNTRREKNPNLNFFIRRFFRIFPLYYLAIIFYQLWGETATTRLWLEVGEHVTELDLITNFLFVHQFRISAINSVVPGGWSIAIEMSFYLLFPIIVSKVNSISSSLIFFLFSLLFMIICNKILGKVSLSEDMHLKNAYTYFYLPSQLPIFALGIFLFYYSTKIRDFTIHLENKYVLILLAIAFVLSKFIIPVHITFSFLILVLIYLVQHKKIKWLVNPLLSKLGELSFGIYLAHYAVFYFYQEIQLNFNITHLEIFDYLIACISCLILTAIIAYILHISIERRFISLGKKIIKRLEN